jgi:hypothetical protein
MHPEMLSALAKERCRDLDATIAAGRAPRARAGTRTRRHARPLTRLALVPKLRVSWTRVTLAAASGNRRRNSVVIVISATRTN